MNGRYAIGVDVGGSHVGCAAVDLERVTIVPGSVVQCDVDNGAAASEILAAWSGAVRRCVSLSGVHPAAAGFAFPGPFDYRNGVSMIRGVEKFEGIFGLDVASSLRSRLRKEGIEHLAFVNDASAFALGETRGGAARGTGRAVVLTLGTGVGSGFVSDGRLVDSGDDVPPCGWVYCLPFEDGIVDDAFSTRWFRRRWREATGREVRGAKEIADRAGDDPAARAIFEEYGQRLGRFIAPLSDRFGADAVVLGGNISRAFPLFFPAMNDALASLGCRVPVKPSALPEGAAIMGTASLFV